MTAGSFGVHLADGRFVVRRAEVDAKETSFILPDGAVVALDPRGELIAVATGSRLALLAMSGATLQTFDLDPELVVKEVEFRVDGERLWVFGTVGPRFHAHAFDRALAPGGQYDLALAQGPYPTTINLHPSEDAFLLTTNEDGRDQDATIHRLGIRVEGGVLRVLFDQDEIDHPSVGFTKDGNVIVGVDAYNGVTLFGWPDTVDSSLMVRQLPSLEEEALIDWSARGAFGKPDDDAGNDLGGSLGTDSFLEVTKDESDAWTLRVWRLEPR